MSERLGFPYLALSQREREAYPDAYLHEGAELRRG
jgi:hypothetical protein